MTAQKKLTVIVPCHNESANIDPFYESITKALDLIPVDWSLLFMNDASTDNTLDKILLLREKDPRVRVATLSRNFGYHAVLVAGLTNSEADLYAIIDVDGEDPPSLLVKFYEAIVRGQHTVYGIRSDRPDPAYILFSRWLFYKINKFLADGPTRLWMAEFSMFTHTVRDYILDNNTTFPFLRAEMTYVGLRMEGVPYVRQPRLRGASHYNFFSMAKFAVGGILASSTFPLRASVHLSALFAAIYFGLVFILRLNFAEAGALAGSMGLFYLLITIPMLSLYLARTYNNVTKRPVFFLDPDRSRLD